VIGFFVKAGDVIVSKAFRPYCWKFRDIVNEKIANKKYGDGLKLILIEFLLEGQFLSLPERLIKISYYRKSEQSISAVVGIPKTFADMEEIEKKRLIAESAIEGVEAVKERMIKKGFDKIDFQQLLDDLRACAKEYLE
jgi:hypothetical protein